MTRSDIMGITIQGGSESDYFTENEPSIFI